jgi:sulfur carrier protein
VLTRLDGTVAGMSSGPGGTRLVPVLLGWNHQVDITLNGEPRSTADGLTVAALLDELGLTKRPLAVEVNRELVPKPRHAEQRLAQGDRVEIVTLVGGG